MIVHSFYKAKEEFVKAVINIVFGMTMVFWLGYFVFSFITQSVGLGFIAGWGLLYFVYGISELDEEVAIEQYLYYLRSGKEQVVHEMLTSINKSKSLKGIFSDTDVEFTKDDLNILKQVFEEGNHDKER
jgi:hypothetical protein